MCIRDRVDTLFNFSASEPGGKTKKYTLVVFYVWNEYRTLSCLLYTSDAADERSSVDLGGRRIIKKKKKEMSRMSTTSMTNEITYREHLAMYIILY